MAGNKKLIILLLVVSISLALRIQSIAQQTYFLNLDSAINIANRQSHKMRMLREDLNQSTYRLQSINRSFLPRIDLNGNFPNYSEEYRQFEDSAKITYYPVKERYYQGDISISQQLPTDGKISITSEVSNLDDFYNHTKLFDVRTGFRFEQPLEAFYTYNSIRARYKEAKLNFDLAQKQYKREELDLVYNISYLFYSLVSSEKQKDIAFQNLNRQDEAYNLAKNKYETGLIKEVEILQIEVDLGEATNQFDLQLTNYLQSANLLKQELGLSLKDSIVTESKLDYKIVEINIEKAVELGLKNRTELSEKNIQIELNKLEIKRQRAQGTVQASFNTYYDFIGMNTYDLYLPYSSAFDQSYKTMQNRPGNFGISLTVHVPILDWGSNRSLIKLQQARLKQNILSLDYQTISIENEIRNTINHIQSSLRRLQLLEKNIKLAEKSYNISYLRFTNGDIDAESLGLDRIRYNTAQQSYLEAFISYKMLLLDLKRKTFYDFETDSLKVQGE